MNRAALLLQSVLGSRIASYFNPLAVGPSSVKVLHQISLPPFFWIKVSIFRSHPSHRPNRAQELCFYFIYLCVCCARVKSVLLILVRLFLKDIAKRATSGSFSCSRFFAFAALFRLPELSNANWTHRIRKGWILLAFLLFILLLVGCMNGCEFIHIGTWLNFKPCKFSWFINVGISTIWHNWQEEDEQD